MAQEWYVVRDGKEIGPFTLAALKERAAKGFLSPDTLIRHVDAEKPVKAGTVKGLFTEPEANDEPEPSPKRKRPSSARTAPATPKSNGLPKQTVIILSAVGVCLFLCCGGFAIFGLQMKGKAEKQLAEADALWDKGDKAGAAAQYRKIIDDHNATLLKDEDRPRVYGRVIDDEYERGDAAVGKTLIDRADKNGVVPAVNHSDAKAAVAALQAEKARAKADKEEPKGGDNNGTRFEVSKGFGRGNMAVEVAPDVSSEIAVSDFSLDNGTLTFKLHWKGSTGGRTRDPWHYSAFDKDGAKVDGGAVGIPSSMELGQRIKARIVLRREDVKEITRVQIHQ